MRRMFLALWLLSMWSTNLHAQADFYKGKTIRVVIGYSAGGTNDLWARAIARFWGKYIPGNPDIIVQNMPGAGTMIAANYIYGVGKSDAYRRVDCPCPVFQPAWRPKRSSIRLGKVCLDRFARGNERNAVHALRQPFQNFGRHSQSDRTAQMRHYRTWHPWPLLPATLGGGSGNEV